MKKLWILSLILLAGCQQTFLGEEPSAGPVDVFETLWKDFDEHYALFGVKGVDWDSLYTVYRPKVSPAISEDSLWNVLCAMLEPLNDSHVSMYDPKSDDRYFNIYLKKTNTGDPYKIGVSQLLADSPTYINDYLCWGRIAGRSVGYIHVASFNEADYPVEDIDKLVACVADNKAVIVDVRDNRGGRSWYAWRLSSWFSDNTRNVLFTEVRNGPSHGDFAPPQAHPNVQRDGNLSGRPVMMLTNSKTVSAGEWFTLSMKTSANVTHIGEITAGAYSTISMNRMLPNGWMYYYSIEKVTLPDGSSPEGIGCVPDIVVRNDPEDYWTDYVSLEALDYLKRNYGI